MPDTSILGGVVAFADVADKAVSTVAGVQIGESNSLYEAMAVLAEPAVITVVEGLAGCAVPEFFGFEVNYPSAGKTVYSFVVDSW